MWMCGVYGEWGLWGHDGDDDDTFCWYSNMIGQQPTVVLHAHSSSSIPTHTHSTQQTQDTHDDQQWHHVYPVCVYGVYVGNWRWIGVWAWFVTAGKCVCVWVVHSPYSQLMVFILNCNGLYEADEGHDEVTPCASTVMFWGRTDTPFHFISLYSIHDDGMMMMMGMMCVKRIEKQWPDWSGVWMMCEYVCVASFTICLVDVGVHHTHPLAFSLQWTLHPIWWNDMEWWCWLVWITWTSPSSSFHMICQ